MEDVENPGDEDDLTSFQRLTLRLTAKGSEA